MDFTITGLKKDSISSKDLIGKMTLIDFWASWCGPCLKKHPKMIELFENSDKEKFQIISISIDEDKLAWLKGVEKAQLPWKNGLDENNLVAKTYGINSIPFNYLLDENGLIIGIDKSIEEVKKMTLK